MENPRSFLEFIESLKARKIETVLRLNENGFIYGITFVDHENKIVFNGSDIGKNYRAAALQKRFTSTTTSHAKSIGKSSGHSHQVEFLRQKPNPIVDQLKNLLRPEFEDSRLLYPLLSKKKRKKRKPHV